MSLSNYGELKTSVSTLLNRDDLAAVVPDFVKILEANVNRDVKFRNRKMEATATLSFTGNEAALPSDFIEARAVVFNSSPHIRLEFLTLSAFQDTYTTTNAANSVHYTITGDKLLVGPYPSTTTVTLTYYQKLPTLTNDSDTNWLLTGHPDVYLYGSCIASAPYLGEDSRLQTWFGLHDRASGAVAGDDARSRFSGSPIAPTVSVTVV